MAREKKKNSRVDLVLSDPPYNVRRDGSDDHAADDLFGSNKMNNAANDLEDVMRLKAHTLEFCFTLQLDLSIRLLLRKRKKCKPFPWGFLENQMPTARRTEA